MVSPALQSTRAEKELLLLRQKYAKLARAFEATRGQWLQTEKTFCRNALRLITATEGLAPSLDPHLQQLSQLLQQQKISRQDSDIDERLETLTHALLQARKSGQDNDSAGAGVNHLEFLFEFVQQLDAGRQHQKELNELKEMALAGAYQRTKTLFESLSRLLQPAARSSLPRQTSGALPADSLEDSIRRNLAGILEATNFPSIMQARAEAISLKLGNPSLCHGQELLRVLSEALGLYIDTIVFLEQEQKALESFLSQLSGQLEDIEQQTSQTAESQSSAENRRLEHHADMEKGLAEMQNATRAASDLDSLKTSINNKITHLAGLLEKQNQFEQAHRIQTSQEMAVLSSKIQLMEQESRELHNRLRVASHMAMHDSLTGIANRLALDETLPGMIAKSQISGSPLVLMIWDIDHFKSINDRFGHAAGDLVLKVVAGKIKEQLREQDFLCRLGGEEFCTLHPDTTIEEGQRLADELRQTIAGSGFNSNGKPISITISCGMSEHQRGDSSDQFMENSDKALYIAKNRGRNRCERYPITHLG